MAILSNSNAISSGGYTLTNSLRFRSSASAYLSRTPTSNGNRQTWTWSAWVKRGSLGSNQVLFGAGLNNGASANELVSIYFNASDQLGNYVVETGVADRNNISSAVYRDPSAWYHIVAVYDSTNATASNRQRLYVNGVQITSFSATSYVSQNYQPSVNSSSYPHAMGKYGFDNSRYFDGYMTEINFIDGQALTPSSFGSTNSTTGVWQPAKYTGTYGTNGFYLKFSDIATTSGSNAGLGKDFSGNSNYWTTNNISVTSGTTYDAMTDSPTLTSATVANYAVMNPLNSSVFTGSLTYSNANLTLLASVSCGATSTIFVNSGKWYAEVTVSAITGSPLTTIGIGTNTSQYYAGYSSDSYAYRSDGQKMNNDTPSAYGSSFTTNDVIGIALDMDAGTLTFYKNNVSQGTAYTGLSGTFGFRLGNGGSGSSTTFNINFGQRPFTYTPPTGYVALNTFNLPTPTILKGNKYMDATLYTGTGTAQSITNAGAFKPDLVWTKSRSSASLFHNLMDSVRGTNKDLYSNSTAAEDTNAQIYTAINSNGFSVGTDNSANQSGQTFVGWQWQAGQGSTSSNTNGSITSTVSVNTTAGFSIVTYTGTGANATVGHGLGVAPKMIIVKNRGDGGANWAVYHVSTGANAVLFLNSTAASTTVSGKWGTPSSTTFGVNTAADVNESGFNLVAYCFAEIAGFSKFGSYTGNGSTDGPFVYLGFRPKFVLIKYSSGIENWAIWDTSRNTYNVMDTILRPDSTAADTSGSTQNIDFVSNGFKIRGTDGKLNTSSGTYIYAAFAENPTKFALAR